MPYRTLGAVLATLTILLTLGTPPAVEVATSDPVRETEVRGTLLPYFQAMRRGDLDRMRPHLADELYQSYATLFEQNTEYARFLRHFYRGGRLDLDEVVAQGDEATAHVRVTLADGTTQTIVLTLARTAPGAWQITRIAE